MDLVDLAVVRRVLSQLPDSDHLLIEVGTPLVKKFGASVVKEIRTVRPSSFVVLDLKTLDTGNLEVRLAADATADAVVISGLAPKKTLELAIQEARKTGIYSVIDMLNVPDPWPSSGPYRPCRTWSRCTGRSIRRRSGTTGRR